MQVISNGETLDKETQTGRDPVAWAAPHERRRASAPVRKLTPVDSMTEERQTRHSPWRTQHAALYGHPVPAATPTGNKAGESRPGAKELRYRRKTVGGTGLALFRTRLSPADSLAYPTELAGLRGVDLQRSRPRELTKVQDASANRGKQTFRLQMKLGENVRDLGGYPCRKPLQGP